MFKQGIPIKEILDIVPRAKRVALYRMRDN